MPQEEPTKLVRLLHDENWRNDLAQVCDLGKGSNPDKATKEAFDYVIRFYTELLTYPGMVEVTESNPGKLSVFVKSLFTLSKFGDEHDPVLALSAKKVAAGIMHAAQHLKEMILTEKPVSLSRRTTSHR